MQDNYKKLVLGFVFDTTFSKVVLIQKNRPEKMIGKLNGIGGKLKLGENRKAGIVREFLEETGVKTTPVEWTEFGVMKEIGKNIYLFATVYQGKPSEMKSITDENVEWCFVNKLPSNLMSNIYWMIPLAKDKLQNDEISYVTIKNNF